MTRYLIRKCKNCSNVIRITQINGKITWIEGARQVNIQRGGGNYYYLRRSQKTVQCMGQDMTGQFGIGVCRTYMLVKNFEEIVM